MTLLNLNHCFQLQSALCAILGIPQGYEDNVLPSKDYRGTNTENVKSLKLIFLYLFTTVA